MIAVEKGLQGLNRYRRNSAISTEGLELQKLGVTLYVNKDPVKFIYGFSEEVVSLTVNIMKTLFCDNKRVPVGNRNSIALLVLSTHVLPGLV